MMGSPSHCLLRERPQSEFPQTLVKWCAKDLASLYAVGKVIKQLHSLLLIMLVSSSVEQSFCKQQCLAT